MLLGKILLSNCRSRSFPTQKVSQKDQGLIFQAEQLAFHISHNASKQRGQKRGKPYPAFQNFLPKTNALETINTSIRPFPTLTGSECGYSKLNDHVSSSAGFFLNRGRKKAPLLSVFFCSHYGAYPDPLDAPSRSLSLPADITAKRAGRSERRRCRSTRSQTHLRFSDRMRPRQLSRENRATPTGDTACGKLGDNPRARSVTGDPTRLKVGDNSTGHSDAGHKLAFAFA